MNICELYESPEFKDILFYMNERGLFTLADLASFDFDELLFVPGVSEEAIAAARKKFLKVSDIPMASATAPEESEYRSSGAIPQTELTEDVLNQQIEDCWNAMQKAVSSTKTLEEVNERRKMVNADNRKISISAFSAVCDAIETFVQKDRNIMDSTEDGRKALIAALSNIPVEDVFREISRGSAMISYCKKHEYYTLEKLIDFNFENTKVPGLGKASMEACHKAYQQAVHLHLKNLASPVSDDRKTAAGKNNADEMAASAEPYREAFYKLSTKARDCLLCKARGQTLQEIGEQFGITRERVRQIILKTVRNLRKPSSIMIKALANNTRSSFYTPDIRQVLSDADELECFAYALKENEMVRYFSFADKYVLSSIIRHDFYAKLNVISQEMIGDIVNYYSIIEDIEDRLSSDGIPFLDALDYMGYLLEHGYKAIGDYVVKNQSTYKRICYTVIEEHFKCGIKLDNDPDNQDILLLKELIKKEFSGYTIKQSNRALTARITPDLILCGRGRYIAAENVVFSEPLFQEIVDYINVSSETSFYYSELFNAFSGRLLAETSVDNANFLHGMLKYFFPDAFRYERDLLVKIGKKRITFADRLSNMILAKGGPVTRTEIESAFPGITDIQIANAMVLNPKIIQWEYHQYNHIDNIRWSIEDYNLLIDAIETNTIAQEGYCSEKNLYDEFCKLDAEFIQNNCIHSSQNIYYISAFLLRDKYRFSRPHIADEGFPDIDLNNIEVAKYFLREKTKFSYQDLLQLSETLEWANGTFTMIANAIEKDYIKIDLNNYVSKMTFHLDIESLRLITRELEKLTRDTGYYGIFSVYNFDSFPSIGYEWNEYLLQSIIDNYRTGYRVLEPKVRDRRYKRGIIVPESSTCMTYEELIIAEMKRDNISNIEKDAFSGYLRRKGLVLTANVPIELMDGEGVRLEKNYFVC